MSRKQELAQLGEAALETLRGPVATEVRRRWADWRDPRARLIRRRRAAKRIANTSAAGAGVFGLGAVASWMTPVVDSIFFWQYAGETAAVGLGGVALAGGVGAVQAGLKYRKLKNTPLPAPSATELLPAPGSAARPPMQRLKEAEQTLDTALAELTSAGAGASAAEARATADAAAAELRRGAQRLVAVESAMRYAPSAEQEELRADVERLRAELDEGVARYGGVVAAAGKAVAASGSGEQRHLLQDATDRLAGLAAGMREVFGEADGSAQH
ncbi:hypothetical protein EIL87_13620 [Saccharopolyspora rhizosphaerae]|uniref:Uncharacterized protein n=1 Tax=Saccharopolyspora rhizosphaerae TaxID=2492662 RepID=A0A3R8QN97_9PSEU|nr:hypothetical protein [Saccharopolyspora rhizosphaerae]RRO16104.1 hypothetical protein EIL87_13620 [Saccharopolyspora rhizosphaerae]